MALPSNVGHGFVTGHFVDSAGAFIEGTITFTASPKRLLNPGATPPTTIMPRPVTVALNEGSFTQQLVATTDQDNNPHDWTYRVDFKFSGVAADPIPGIEVPEDATVDLTTVTPVSAGNGTTVIRGAGVPEGGTEGQVLTVVAGEPTWAAPTGGGEGGTALTSYATQVETLADYPATFPADLSGLSTVATTGAYGDLTGQPTIPNPADFATAAQGAKADSAVQPAAIADFITAADVPAAPTWGTIAGKPAVVAEGTSQTAARNAIGAGTSNLQLGTGPTTAKAGDYTPSVADVPNLPASKVTSGTFDPARIPALPYATEEQGTKADSAVQPGDLEEFVTTTGWGILPTIYINGDGTWPTRTLPAGYTGPVNWDSAAITDATAPNGALDGDRWTRQGSSTPAPTNPTYIGGTQNGTAGTATLAVTIPAEAQTGDSALVFVDSMNNTVPAHTLPAGWTLIARARDTENITSDLYSKTLTAGDTGNITITLGQADIRIHAQMVVYRDVNLSTSVATWDTLGGAATVTTPAGTATEGAIVIGHVSERGNPVGTGWTPPGGFTERLDGDPGYAAGVTVRSATGDLIGATAGPVGGDVWTSTATLSHQAAWTVVLPAA